jgi:hypothetical protein
MMMISNFVSLRGGGGFLFLLFPCSRATHYIYATNEKETSNRNNQKLFFGNERLVAKRESANRVCAKREKKR